MARGYDLPLWQIAQSANMIAAPPQQGNLRSLLLCVIGHGDRGNSLAQHIELAKLLRHGDEVQRRRDQFASSSNSRFARQRFLIHTGHRRGRIRRREVQGQAQPVVIGVGQHPI